MDGHEFEQNGDGNGSLQQQQPSYPYRSRPISSTLTQSAHRPPSNGPRRKSAPGGARRMVSPLRSPVKGYVDDEEECQEHPPQKSSRSPSRGKSPFVLRVEGGSYFLKNQTVDRVPSGKRPMIASRTQQSTSFESSVYTNKIKESNNNSKQEKEKEEEPPEEPVATGRFYVAATDKYIGSVYRKVVEIMLEKGWIQERSFSSQCHVIIGGALGKGIVWRLLGQRYGFKPLANYRRGFKCICRKGAFLKTLRAYCAAYETRLPEFVPVSYLFYPKNMLQSELEGFANDYYSRGEEEDNVWILKPTKGSKGRDIVCMNDFNQILSFLEEQRLASGPVADCWVVQKYIERPLLLPGDRKFDMRCWVLLNHNYDIYIYTEGVFRTCSVPFSLDDLSDQFAHLSNHCIQEHHPAYGTWDHEPTNELFYAGFDRFLRESGAAARGVTLRRYILPQVEYIAVHTLLAARAELEPPAGAGYAAFNLFGFDFMLDARHKAWLLEVNSSPAVAADLNARLCADLVELTVGDYVGRGLDAGALRAPAAAPRRPAASPGNGFKKIYPRKKVAEKRA